MTVIELLPEQIKAIFEVATGEKIKDIQFQFNQIAVSDPVTLKKIVLNMDRANIKRENNQKEV